MTEEIKKSNGVLRISKTKLSRENAVKEFERIMELAEIAEFSEDAARPFINKIMFGKLFVEKNSICYELSKPIEMGSGMTRKVGLLAPDSRAFKDNGVSLSDFNEDGEGRASEETMVKCVGIFLGIPQEMVESGISIKDQIAIFQIGTVFFLTV